MSDLVAADPIGCTVDNSGPHDAIVLTANGARWILLPGEQWANVIIGKYVVRMSVAFATKDEPNEAPNEWGGP